MDDIPQLVQVATVLTPTLGMATLCFRSASDSFQRGASSWQRAQKVLGYAVSHPIRYAKPPVSSVRSQGGWTSSTSTILQSCRSCKTRYALGKAFGGHPRWTIGSRRGVWSRAPVRAVLYRFGFREEVVDGALREKTRNYGDNAVYMSLRTEGG